MSNSDSGVFALAVDIPPNEDICKSFLVVAASNLSSREYCCAIFLCNLMSNAYMWRVLKLDMESSGIIKQILKPPPDNKTCELCINQMKELDSSDVFVDLGLDKAQRDLADLIASNVKCDDAQSVQIVWGAPGTGETRMLSALLEAFQGRKAKILVCASLVSSFSFLCSSMLESIRRQPRVYDGLPANRMDDAILLCDKADGMAIRSTQVKEFCIGLRLKEIMPCMSWKSRINGLINFLEQGFRKEGKKVEKKLKGKAKGNNLLLQLLRQVFEDKSNILMMLLKTLWIYAPSHIFPAEVAERVEILFHSFEELKKLLQNKNTTDDDVKYIFNFGREESSTSSCINKSTNKSCTSNSVNVSPSFVKEMRQAIARCLKCLKYIGRHHTVTI